MVNSEFQNTIKETLYCNNEICDASLEIIALKSLIIHVLGSSVIPEEKIKDLAEKGCILDYLCKLCRPVMAATIYEIEDIIMSSRF